MKRPTKLSDWIVWVMGASRRPRMARRECGANEGRESPRRGGPMIGFGSSTSRRPRPNDENGPVRAAASKPTSLLRGQTDRPTSRRPNRRHGIGDGKTGDDALAERDARRLADQLRRQFSVGGRQRQSRRRADVAVAALRQAESDWSNAGATPRGGRTRAIRWRIRVICDNLTRLKPRFSRRGFSFSTVASSPQTSGQSLHSRKIT